ncbi:MAG: DUF4124 domain-containing protein [Burkholderiales bacterium]|jgi:outer membrane protein assembly factor BamE (lipoprotein component of BamABCDE complex)|nr:DUF4124 domain-containing protein [Burkholderiales bacterium]
MKAVIFVLVALFVATAHAAVYKCMNAAGEITFSDKPCMGMDSEPMRLLYDKSGDPEVGTLQNRVAMGQVTAGMTASQVRQAWGNPSGITTSKEGGVVKEEWNYQRDGQSQKVVLVDGKVVEASSQTLPRAANGSAKAGAAETPMMVQRTVKDANERRFIREGMTSVEVHSRIGEPDSRARVSCRTETLYNPVGLTGEWLPEIQTTREVCEDCWVYNPAAGDPQIETTVCFMNGQASSVTRRVVR